jgi:exopolyphosphatase/guanosine-5'-triphosphate,3'-diphosphate pyrophosphatase
MSERNGSPFPARVAAVDLGSNAIRFLAAEFPAVGQFVTVEAERAPVRLGHDVFLSGKLTREAMASAVEVLRNFRTRMDALGVSRYRAVATSAVRESSNGDKFVERVRREAGLELEAIPGSEEARLVHLAVRNRLALGREQWILADLGGGSVEVSLVDDNGILWSESHTMGSVRLLEELAGVGQSPGRFRRLLEEYVSTLRLPSAASYRPPAGFIATGGNIETLARLATGEPGGDGTSRLALKRLSEVIETLSKLSFRQRVDELGLREDRADVILPAALVYERLARLAGAETVLVPNVGIREGVVLDLVDDLAAHVNHEDRQSRQILDGAVNLGRRYLFDEAHGSHVASLALSLFDQLAPLHGLGNRDRSVLAAAAVLHDIGAYISYKRHHKHSMYLISNSELPGLGQREMQVVANIARYHRKSEPEPDHTEFMALAEQDRQRVTVLGALLRMADACDRDHRQRVTNLHARVDRGVLSLRLEGEGDLLLERWALQRKSDFFSRVFKVKVRVDSVEEPS